MFSFGFSVGHDRAPCSCYRPKLACAPSGAGARFCSRPRRALRGAARAGRCSIGRLIRCELRRNGGVRTFSDLRGWLKGLWTCWGWAAWRRLGVRVGLLGGVPAGSRLSCIGWGVPWGRSGGSPFSVWLLSRVCSQRDMSCTRWLRTCYTKQTFGAAAGQLHQRVPSQAWSCYAAPVATSRGRLEWYWHGAVMLLLIPQAEDDCGCACRGSTCCSPLDEQRMW